MAAARLPQGDGVVKRADQAQEAAMGVLGLVNQACYINGMPLGDAPPSRFGSCASSGSQLPCAWNDQAPPCAFFSAGQSENANQTHTTIITMMPIRLISGISSSRLSSAKAPG